MFSKIRNAFKRHEIDLRHLARIADSHQHGMDSLRKRAADANADPLGSHGRFLIEALRDLAAAAYHLDHDPVGWRRQLDEAGRLGFALVQRSAYGFSVEPSRLSPLVYTTLLDLLAAGNLATAEQLARRMLLEDDSEKYAKFDLAFAYSLKHLVLKDANACRVWLTEFVDACAESDTGAFAGYPKVIEAILMKDAGRCEKGLHEILRGHRTLIAKGGELWGTDQIFMCTWALGLTNLALRRGLHIELPDDEFLPRDLLLQVG